MAPGPGGDLPPAIWSLIRLERTSPPRVRRDNPGQSAQCSPLVCNKLIRGSGPESHFCITQTDPAVPGRTWMRLCGGRSLARFRLMSCDSSSLKATSVISRATEHLEVHVKRLHRPSRHHGLAGQTGCQRSKMTTAVSGGSHQLPRRIPIQGIHYCVFLTNMLESRASLRSLISEFVMLMHTAATIWFNTRR